MDIPTLDTEVLEAFMLTMNGAELALFNAETNDADDADDTDAIPALALLSARRLGHPEITIEDARTIAMVDVLALIEKAAKVHPERNQRVNDLLAELGK